MIGNKHEYEKLSQVENFHWWYFTLHKQVARAISSVFADTKTIKILDAGCGTGGLMEYLISQGYNNIEGIDLSSDAINFASKKNLDVSIGNIVDVNSNYPVNNFDIIVATDVLYFVDKQDWKTVTSNLSRVLRNGGLLILNMPAYKIFRGIHDAAVGISDRLETYDIPLLYEPLFWREVDKYYWPTFVAPIIMLVRAYQRIKIQIRLNVKIVSDLNVPPALINELLIRTLDCEIRGVRSKKIGSSMFIVLQNDKGS